MTEGLRRMTRTLGMRHQLANAFRGRDAHDGELDGHLFEVCRRIVDVVLLGISKAGPNVRRCILDRDLIEWREPRQLGQQSKRRSHHQVLEG
jgi:hypothetical protein